MYTRLIKKCVLWHIVQIVPPDLHTLTLQPRPLFWGVWQWDVCKRQKRDFWSFPHFKRDDFSPSTQDKSHFSYHLLVIIIQLVDTVSCWGGEGNMHNSAILPLATTATNFRLSVSVCVSSSFLLYSPTFSFVFSFFSYSFVTFWVTITSFLF